MTARGTVPKISAKAEQGCHMKTVGMLCLVSVLYFGAEAHAEPFTGNDVYNACQSSDGDVRQGFCWGFILGSVEGMKWGALIGVVASSPSSENLDRSEFDMMSRVRTH
jgi:hypothetical protein